MVTTFDHALYAGETVTFEVTVTQDDGTPYDLTGAAIAYRADTPTPIAKEVGAGVTLTDAAAGKFEVDLDEADTLGLGPLMARHECRIAANGEVFVAFAGTLRVSASLHGEMGS